MLPTDQTSNKSVMNPDPSVKETMSGDGRTEVGRGDLARQAAGMGRSWLPSGVDPVADLIAERAREDDEEDAS